jgi:hypothetical protein
MHRKSRLAALVAVVAFAAVGAGSAVAGEVTGPFPNGKPLWVDPATHQLHGASLCAYSGLNIPSEEPDQPATRTQSYGQIVAAGGKAFATSPGVACNPTSGFSE